MSDTSVKTVDVTETYKRYIALKESVSGYASDLDEALGNVVSATSILDIIRLTALSDDTKNRAVLNALSGLSSYLEMTVAVFSDLISGLEEVAR